MRRITFDLEVLRSFVLGVELGSFAKASDRLARSTSAVSAQLKKLEEQVGVPVLRKSGRGMVLTPAGEMVMAYARRLLQLNDEASSAIQGANLEGLVRIGLQEDFSEGLLADILGDFARAHPKVSIEARSARNVDLLEQVDAGRIDLALAWDAGSRTANQALLGELPMCWIGAGDETLCALEVGAPVPLVSFEAPCLMRSAACAALDRAGMPWRIAFTGLGLGSLWAAAGAGLGVAVRTRAGMPPYLRVRDDLPALPKIGLLLHYADASPAPVVARLAEIVQARLHSRIFVGTRG